MLEPLVSPTKTVTMTPAEALARAMAGVDSSLFVSAKFTAPHSANGAPATARGLSFVTRTASKDHGDPMLGAWEADLVAGAVAEMLTPSGPISDTIATVMHDAVEPDGQHVDGVGYPLDPYLAGTVFPAAAWSDAEITAKITAVAAGAGLAVGSIRVLHPLDPAPVIVLRLPADEHSFTREGYTALLHSLCGTGLGSDSCDYSGYYLELDNASGLPVIRVDSAIRVSAGTVWASPDSPIGTPYPLDSPAASTPTSPPATSSAAAAGEPTT